MTELLILLGMLGFTLITLFGAILSFVFIFILIRYARSLGGNIRLVTEIDLSKEIKLHLQEYPFKSEFGLKDLQDITGVVDRSGSKAKNHWSNEWLVLGESSEKPQVVAVAVLNQYKPIFGLLMAKIGKDDLKIRLSSNKEYEFSFNNNVIGFFPFTDMFQPFPNWIQSQDRIDVIRHSRPKMILETVNTGIFTAAMGQIDYEFFRDTSQNAIASVNRGLGSNPISWTTQVPLLSAETTHLEYLDPSITIQEKALILGFLLMDKLYW